MCKMSKHGMRLRSGRTVGGSCTASSSKSKRGTINTRSKRSLHRKRGGSRFGRVLRAGLGFVKHYMKPAKTEEAVHGEVKQSSFKLILGKKHKERAPNVFKFKGVFNIVLRQTTTGESLQLAYDLYGGTNNIFIADALVENGIQSYWSLFSCNPYQTNSGGTHAASTAVPLNDAVRLWSSNLKLRICNFSTIAPVTVKIYIAVCVRDTNNSFVAAWNSALLSQNLGLAPVVYPNGANPAVVGYRTCNTIGENPYGLKDLAKEWKIVKCFTYDMVPGANMVCNYKAHYFGKTLYRNYLIQANSGGNNFLKGLSWGAVITGIGGLIIDPATVAGTANQVATAPVELGVICERETCGSAVKDTGKNYRPVYVNLPTQDVNTTLKGINVVDVITTLAQAL